MGRMNLNEGSVLVVCVLSQNGDHHEHDGAALQIFFVGGSSSACPSSTLGYKTASPAPSCSKSLVLLGTLASL